MTAKPRARLPPVLLILSRVGVSAAAKSASRHVQAWLEVRQDLSNNYMMRGRDLTVSLYNIWLRKQVVIAR